MSSNSSRIVGNSILLFLRMLVTSGLNLFATRLTLQNLGVEDMGVYGIVGSVVSTITVLTAGITNTVQRFLTYELGRKDGDVGMVFRSTMSLLFIVAAVLLLLLESAGLWMLHNAIDIPDSSREYVGWVFQLSVLVCIVNVISIPFNALVIAYERMGAFALVSALQVLLNCIGAWALCFFQDARIIWYSAFMAASALAIRIIYQLYCKSRIGNVIKYRWTFNKAFMADMGRYAGVTTLSGIFISLSGQGIALVLNWIFGVAINAVYNISLQLKNMLLSFAFNIFKAISPQITKTYAAGDIQTHKRLVYSGSKAQVFVLSLILIPILFRIDYLMGVWLDEKPPFVAEFSGCMVLVSLLYAAFEPLRSSVLATGKIAKFMLIPDSIQFIILPLIWLLSMRYKDPRLMAVVIVAVEFLVCGFRLWYGTRDGVIRLGEVLKLVVLPCLYVLLPAVGTCWIVSPLVGDNLVGFIVLLMANMLAISLFGWLFGLDGVEKGFVKNLFNMVWGKIKGRRNNLTENNI